MIVAVRRGPSAHKTPISCQTPGLYCWPGDKPNLLASHMPALSHSLITVAITAPLVSPLGLSVLTVFTALFPWHRQGQPGNPRCHLLRAPGRSSLWLRSLAHQPGTSLTRLAATSPNTRCLISSSSSPPSLPPSPPPSLLPPLLLSPPLHLYPDGMVIEIRGIFSGIAQQGCGRGYFQTVPPVIASSIQSAIYLLSTLQWQWVAATGLCRACQAVVGEQEVAPTISRGVREGSVLPRDRVACFKAPYSPSCTRTRSGRPEGEEAGWPEPVTDLRGTQGNRFPHPGLRQAPEFSSQLHLHKQSKSQPNPNEMPTFYCLQCFSSNLVSFGKEVLLSGIN